MQRQTLIFDADDTLWENNVLFERVVDGYLDWIAHPTLDRAALRAVLDDVERANVPVHGYGSASFLRSLHDAFEKLSERPATEAERTSITDLASALVNHEVELVPGVAETLAREAGLGAVFIPNAYTWTLEHDEVPEDVLTLERFPDLLDHF